MSFVRGRNARRSSQRPRKKMTMPPPRSPANFTWCPSPSMPRRLSSTEPRPKPAAWLTTTRCVPRNSTKVSTMASPPMSGTGVWCILRSPGWSITPQCSASRRRTSVKTAASRKLTTRA